MRIKELEDVLVLVDQMPEERQLRIARRIAASVDDWEAQQAEGVDDDEWWGLRGERNAATRKVVIGRLIDVLKKIGSRE